MEKMRIDRYLVERGLAPSRERARAMIQAGQVYVAGRQITKPAEAVAEDAVPEIRGEVLPFVSRGGLKLQKAVAAYALDLAGRVAMDVGSSTGGFTDCMLQSGAGKVYAIDVGTDQLHPSLREDPRVVVMEQRNAREMTPDWFDETPDFAATDVSFISVRLILPAMYACLAPGGQAVILVKPQFEAGRSRVGKNGVVRDKRVHQEVLTETAQFAAALGFSVRALDYSPITGPEGNIEFLMLLEKGNETALSIPDAAARVVNAAHEAL
ncbi:MAG: TlyA family RNA methyltransferase [Ruminococcaceae bacterium]|nr:TlyA family RNA methyltransferase [Oscillospiraceae bacterium]